MRICHLCLNGPYNEGWNYQENVLPKYHVKQRHIVYQLVTQYMWEGSRQVPSVDKRYTNPIGVRVIRCHARKGIVGGSRFNRYPELKALLVEISPEILFIHDIQFIDVPVVVRFLKDNRSCRVFVDNHSDFSNSATNWFSKNILHKIIWRHFAKLINPYTTKFYGVLPARVDFLVEVYKLPKEKVELLVMGADDELVEKAKRLDVKMKLREQYNISPDDFLLMTGGKIDQAKRQTLLLMQAVKEIQDEHVKLIVFGSVVDELKDELIVLADGKKVQYIGWVDSKESYDYFASADLVVFPGRHSVFWEQVVAQGIPLIVKYWKGTTHIDIGGNCQFLFDDSVSEIKSTLLSLIESPEKYTQLREAAEKGEKNNFLYSEIAKKSIIL